MLEKNPFRRITAENALKHPYFKKTKNIFDSDNENLIDEDDNEEM